MVLPLARWQYSLAIMPLVWQMSTSAWQVHFAVGTSSVKSFISTTRLPRTSFSQASSGRRPQSAQTLTVVTLPGW